MRHSTCLVCKYAPDPALHPLTVITETLSPDTHHHHAISCESCGAWWFDDVVTGGLGIAVPARRDTVMCGCPEDDQHQFTRSAITVPGPESACACTASKVNRHAVRIRTGSGR